MRAAPGFDPCFRESKKIPWSAKVFALAAGYTVLPFLELPFVGLSLSAILFYLLFMDVFLKARRRVDIRAGGWIRLALWLGAGFFFSALVNGLSSSGSSFGKTEMIVLIRCTYWLIVFVTTLLFASLRPWIFPLTAGVFSLSVFLLALVRLYEAIRYGSYGAWMELKFMTQNEYAFIFSANTVFIAGFLMQAEARKRMLAILGLGIVLAVVLMNGSRSSWIAIAASFAVFGWICAAADPKKGRGIFKAALFLVLLGGLMGIFSRAAPQEVRERFVSRFSTLESLDQDKSYQIRKVMIQKAIKIMQKHPLWGCGPGRFRFTRVELEMPRALRHFSSQKFESKSSHNAYMQFFAETGLAGGLPYLTLLVLFLGRGYSAAVFMTRRKHYWAAALYASFIAMSIHLWSLAGLTGTMPWLKYGLVAGMIVTSANIRRFLRTQRSSEGQVTERAVVL
ncbi:MAG: O-antigen ligase family protein [Candidatus Omnitrophica bacterium]|nr:O-antigen ligase family protein [Candidatus Omnitrophota bacterium]